MQTPELKAFIHVESRPLWMLAEHLQQCWNQQFSRTSFSMRACLARNSHQWKAAMWPTFIVELGTPLYLVQLQLGFRDWEDESLPGCESFALIWELEEGVRLKIDVSLIDFSCQVLGAKIIHKEIVWSRIKKYLASIAASSDGVSMAGGADRAGCDWEWPVKRVVD